VALDSEYDACMDTNLKIPCKITIVNEKGVVILDTLMNQNDSEGKPRNLQRMVAIHGIKDKVLVDAPTFDQVKTHLTKILDPETTVIIGHSIKQDLLVMELTGYKFIDTSLIIDHK
jgi:DNA polymerase III epsilon subunit-like protein